MKKITFAVTLGAILCGCLTFNLLNAAEPAASGNDLRSLFTAGDAAYKKGKYAEGIEKLLAAQKVANTPWYKFAIDYRLAQCYYYTKKYQQSVDAAKSALSYSKIGNKDHNLMTNRAAEALLNMQKYDEAMQIVQQQLASSKREQYNYYQTMLLEGRILSAQKKFTEADQAFEKCQQFMKLSGMDQAKLYWNRGVNFQNANDLTKAREYYKKAVGVGGNWFSKDAQRRLDLLDKKSSACNLLPDGSFEHCAGRTWNRMIDLGYAPGDFLWKQVDNEAFHGKYSLRSNGTESLLLPGEGKFTNGHFSIYLKSPSEGAKVKVEFFAYKSFERTLLASQIFTLNNSWQLCHLKLKYIWLPVDPRSTPFVAVITPLDGDKTIYADAAQLENSALLPYADYNMQLLTSAEAQKVFLKRFAPLQKPTASPDSPLPKEFQISAHYPTAAEKVPLAVALPFKPGEFTGSRSATVLDSSGNAFPAEVEPIACHPQDGSVRSAIVRFNARLSGGIDRFTVKPAVTAAPTLPWPELPPLELFAADHTGKYYQAKDLHCVLTAENILTRRWTARGVLSDENGFALAGYTLYLEQNKTAECLRITCTLYNLSADHPLVISHAGVRLHSSRPGQAALYRQFHTLKTQSFLHKADGSPAAVSANGGTLLLREGSLRHPVELSVDENGVFTGTLYPQYAALLYISRQMSLTREFIYTPATSQSAAVKQLGYRSTAMASGKHFADANFLTVPVKSADPRQEFAYSKFKQLRSNMLITPEMIFDHPKKHILHGMFNYGDLYGDRGWGNLESYLDMAEILYAISMDDVEVLSSALNRAVHYRDVDIVDGSAVIHGPNHSGSWIYEFSHSWPQGVILHYLLTGDPRSLEVIQRTAERYQETPVDYKHIADSRSLGRFMLGLADFYSLLGDKKLKKRFNDQLEYAEKHQLGPQFKDQTIFHWNGRTDPFHVWYGACALMQMYKSTGEAKILQSFKREMDASLNMDFFRHDLNELWSGLPVEQTLPIQLGYHSHHRGSLFYPLMDFYSKNCGKKEYRKLAALAAYAEFLRGAPYPEPMDILRTNVLSQMDEKSLLSEALQLRKSAAADGFIRNGDFSADRKWFRNWHLPSDRQMSYDDVMESWPLEKVKNYAENLKKYNSIKDKISPWRNYSRNYGYIDNEEFYTAPPALKVTVGNWYPHGTTAWLDSAPAYLTPGKWKLSGSFKLLENFNMQRSVLVLNFTPEKGMTRAYRFKPGTVNGDLPVAVWYTTNCLESYQARVSNGNKPHWRTFEFTFENKMPGIAVFRAIFSLQSGKKQADVWFDDIKLERYHV